MMTAEKMDSTILPIPLYENPPFSPWIVPLLFLGGLTIMSLIGPTARSTLNLGARFTFLLGFIAFLASMPLLYILHGHETQPDKVSWIAPHYFSLKPAGDGKPTDDESQHWKNPGGVTLDHCIVNVEKPSFSLSTHPVTLYYSMYCRDIATEKTVALTKDGKTKPVVQDEQNRSIH